MSGSTSLALHGLLVALADVEHVLALEGAGEVGPEEAVARLREHVESDVWTTNVMLARAVLAIGEGE
jgi:hypothetical protein